MKTETKDDIMSGLTFVMILLILVVPISFWIVGFLTETIKVETSLSVIYYTTGICGTLVFIFPFIKRRIGTVAAAILFITLVTGLVIGGSSWLRGALNTPADQIST
jgi:hypothetical protein